MPGTTLTRPVNNQAEADEILDGWVQALRECIRGCASGHVAGIGFAMPGPFDYVHGIGLFKGRPKYHNLHEVNVEQRIRQFMHLTPSQAVRFMNDATAFAIGRILISIIENYQQKDGSVVVPKVLQPLIEIERIKPKEPF